MSFSLHVSNKKSHQVLLRKMVGSYQLKPLGLGAGVAEALDSASLLREPRAVRVAPAAVDFDSESYTRNFKG